jgi:hypothetical protein
MQRRLVLSLVRFWLDFLSKRAKLFAFLNLLFFGGVVLAAFAAGFVFWPVLGSPLSLPSAQSLFGNNFLLMVLGIFFFNLGLSAFVFVTLPGLVFFPLSAAALGFRAFLWGLLVYASSLVGLVWALPTLVLEGEAYVFAGVVGTVWGVSWFKPSWLNGEENVSRSESLWRTLRTGLRVYVLIALLLFVAALIETVTIFGGA